MNENKSDMLKAMIEAMKEGDLKFGFYNQYATFMNTKDYNRWKQEASNTLHPPHSPFIGVDPGIYHSDFVPEGKAYRVPKSSLRYDFKPEIKFDEKQVDEAMVYIGRTFARHGFSGIWGGVYGARQDTRTAEERLYYKLYTSNPNWSQEWDEWRNREDYRQFRIYRWIVAAKNWLLRKGQ